MIDRLLDRRSMLRLGLLALAGTAVPVKGVASAGLLSPAGDGSTSLTGLVRVPQETISLPKVRVLPDRIIRKVAGLRPYRSSGFLVRAERLGGKVVIHNYGHGGCG